MKGNRDIYAEVTQNIIAKLEEGVVPWRRPWTPPTNYISKKSYRGVNVWLLYDGTSPYWLTYRQAQGLGGHVRKGERGAHIIFWKIAGKDVTDDDTGEVERRTIPLLRSYTVFNLDQCDGIEADTVSLEPIASAEDVILSYEGPPRLEYGGHRASYSPSLDTVHMPHQESFQSASGYYSTMFHELAHSTGHSSRLSRIQDTQFASESYSHEELIAEMGAAYLCAVSGTELVAQSLDNTTAYIRHWKSMLGEDKRLIVRVSSQAQRGADWVRNIRAHFDNTESGAKSVTPAE